MSMCLTEMDMVDMLFDLKSDKHLGKNYHGKAAVIYRTCNGVQSAVGEPEYIRQIIETSGKGTFYLIPADEDTLLTDEVRAAFKDVDIQ